MGKKKHRSPRPAKQGRSSRKSDERSAILAATMSHALSAENRVKTREYIKQCGSPLAAAHGVFASYTEAIDQEPRNGLPIACKPGCWYCCMMPVAATPFEFFLAFGAIRKLPGPERERIRRRVEEHVAAQKEALGQAPDQRVSFSRQCPLLTEDGQCSVYSHRPLVCRGIFSIDAERCRRAFVDDDEGDLSVPFQVMSNIVQMSVPQLMVTLYEGGMDHVPTYELASSIYTIWNDQELLNKWLRGERFAAQGFPHMAEAGEIFPAISGLPSI